MHDHKRTKDLEIREDPIGASVAEMLSRAFRWGAKTAVELRDWENRVSLKMLGEVENEFQALSVGKGSSLQELVRRIRESVGRWISDAETGIIAEIEAKRAVRQDFETAEKEARRLRAAKSYVALKMESKIATIYEMGGDVAVSYVLRMNRQVHDVEAEKESLALRLSKLNGTLQEAILKFRNHTSRLETEKGVLETSLDKATREKNAAIQEKDLAVSEKNLALEEAAKAKAETQTAKNLYEKVAAKAKKADSINALLRWRGFYSDKFEENVATLLADFESAKREVEKLSGERESYQKATALVAALERRILELESGETPEFEKVRVQVETRERGRIEESLRMAAAGYLATNLRLQGSDPEPVDYADYERHSRDLQSFSEHAKNLGIPAFDLVQAEMESVRETWKNDKPLLLRLGISSSVVLKTYERCLREAAEWALPFQTARKAVEWLRFYREIAGIGKKDPPPLLVTDAEIR